MRLATLQNLAPLATQEYHATLSSRFVQWQTGRSHRIYLLLGLVSLLLGAMCPHIRRHYTLLDLKSKLRVSKILKKRNPGSAGIPACLALP